MIRTSKHNISDITNKNKLNMIDNLFNDYKLCLEYYINLIIEGKLPLKKYLSSKDLPIFNIKHSRYRSLIYKQASEIIRSNFKKSNNKRFKKYQKIYSYFKKNNRQINFINRKFSELNLKDIVTSKYYIKPNINNITINLDSRFYDIRYGNSFDNFIKIILPYFNEKGTRALNIKVPFKQHKHSNNLISNNFKLKNTIQLIQVNNKIYINLIYEKKVNKKIDGKSLGFDIGYKKLIVDSNSSSYGLQMKYIYERISNKKQGSKNFKQLLIHRDNEINRIINNIDLDDIKTLIIEDLKNVKKNSKGKVYKNFNNKLQRWVYTKVIDKIERTCEEKGIYLVKVSPSYTSQTCSSCGNINKESRKGENYKCISCGYRNDADINAAINIHNRGVYSLSNN